MDLIKLIHEHVNNAGKAEQNLQVAIANAFEGNGNSDATKRAYDDVVRFYGEDKAKLIKQHIVDAHQEKVDRTKTDKEPFFKDDIVENMRFKLDGKKHAPARTNYPKTNFKRSADDWNTKVAKWAAEHKKAGNVMLKREGDGESLIVDAIDKKTSEMVSTLVVSNRGELHKDMTIDVYNQQDGADNKYSKKAKHEGVWEFKHAELGNTHHSDQRNMPTSKTATVNHRGRHDDGKSLQHLARSTRK